MIHNFSNPLYPSPIHLWFSLAIIVWAVGIYYLKRYLESRKFLPKEIKTPTPQKIELPLLTQLSQVNIGSSKEIYYSMISEIFKKYLNNTLHSEILSMTYEEIKWLEIPDDYVQLLKKLLIMQYAPAPNDTQEIRRAYYDQIYTIIDHFENYESR